MLNEADQEVVGNNLQRFYTIIRYFDTDHVYTEEERLKRFEAAWWAEAERFCTSVGNMIDYHNKKLQNENDQKEKEKEKEKEKTKNKKEKIIRVFKDFPPRRAEEVC